MGFNRRKMQDDRKAKADAEAASRRATDAQVLEDAEGLIGADSAVFCPTTPSHSCLTRLLGKDTVQIPFIVLSSHGCCP